MIEIKYDGKNPEHCAAVVIDKNHIQSLMKCNKDDAYLASMIMVHRTADLMGVPVKDIAYAIANMPKIIPDMRVDLNLLSEVLGKEF